jgi:O-methyltransferase domain/Dimerisation domain
LQALLGGFAVTQMLYVAARLNLADHLARGPLTVEELATECEARPDPLRRIVRALAAAGVFAVDESGTVSNTALSECLRSGAPDSLRPLALVYGEEHYHALTELLSAVRRGGTAFEHAYRKSHYSYLASNLEAARAYNEAINIEAARSAEAAVRARDFSRAQTVVDVGGREGHLIRAVLHANRHVKGVLVESSGFANKARARLRADGLTDRCEVEVADIFDAVPPAGDVYALNGVIGTLDDERALLLLRNCRRAMSVHARLLIIDEQDEALSDAIALAVSGGRGRTLDEHQTLIAKAGLKLISVQSTGAGDNIIEACSS